MPLFLVSGCGDLEPEMQDTRSVILNMDFDQRSSSRTSSVSPAELSNYKTHLIMVLNAGKNLSNSSYWNYNSNLGDYVLYDSDRKITLNMKLNTEMKIFAFLFRENYSHYDLFSAKREVGYYGESQSFIIGSQTDSLRLSIRLTQVLGTDTGGATDNTAPTASVTSATITTTGNAVVKSTETGTAYLVNTAITVSNLDSITGAADNQWNSVAISLANTDTNLPATGLADGTYKVYAVDAVGNLSSASSNSVTVATDYALDFDGTNDYVAADGVTSNLNSSTGLPFTVSAWAYPDTTVSGTTACCSQREAIFAFNNSGANLNLLFYAQDGSTQKFYHHGTASNSYTGSSNTFESGQWHHIVMVVDSSGNGKLYVNGGQEATWSNGSNSSVNRFSIGQEWDSSTSASDFFDGKIDEVAIWNVALSAADVTTLYNSGNGLKASADSGNYDNSDGLIGYWKFNEGTGSTLTDNTSNSNNGTLTNMDSSDWVTSGLNLIY